MRKIYHKKQIAKGVCGIVCPNCDSVLASASEMKYLPEWSVCNDCSNVGVKVIDKKTDSKAKINLE